MKRSVTAAILVLVLCVAIGFLVSWKKFGGGELSLPFVNAERISEDFGGDSDYTVCDDATITVSPKGLENLDISWFSGSVSIGCHSGEDILLTETSSSSLSEAQHMRYEIDGDTLDIRFGKELASVPAKKLVVLLPQSLNLDEINVKTGSANVELESLKTVKSVILNCVSGSVTARELGDVYVGAQTVSGDIEVTTADSKGPMLLTVSGSIYLDSTAKDAVTVVTESVSGSVEVHFAATPERFHSESISGSVEVYLPQDSVFIADFDTKSGSLDCDFPQKDGVYSMEAESWGSLSVPKHDCVIEAETVSGSLSILAEG